MIKRQHLINRNGLQPVKKENDFDMALAEIYFPTDYTDFHGSLRFYFDVCFATNSQNMIKRQYFYQ